MSSRRRVVDLSTQAREDYEDTLLYSLLTWGERQEAAYRAAIDQALRRLARFPYLGPARDDILPGYRGLRVKHHLIVYRVDGAVITVARILHERQETSGTVAE